MYFFIIILQSKDLDSLYSPSRLLVKSLGTNFVDRSFNFDTQLFSSAVLDIINLSVLALCQPDLLFLLVNLSFNLRHFIFWMTKPINKKRKEKVADVKNLEARLNCCTRPRILKLLSPLFLLTSDKNNILVITAIFPFVFPLYLDQQTAKQ